MDGPVESRIYDLATACKTALEDGWPADLTPLPARRYVTIGNPAADDEQLVIWVPRTIGMGTGANVGQQGIAGYPNGIDGLRAAIVMVQLLRRIHTVDSEGTAIVLPSVTDLEADAKTLLSDVQAIANVLIDAQHNGALAGFGNLAFETADAIDASGGLAGHNHRIRLGLW